MKILRHILVLLVCIALGLAIGTLCSLVRKTNPPQHTSVVRIHAVPSPIAEAAAAVPSQLPLAAQLERDLANSTGVRRWLHWMAAIEKASLSELPKLVQLAAGDAAALRAIAMRWIDLDPKNLLHFLAGSCDRNSYEVLSDVLFREWASRDPKALIKELDEASSLRPLRVWRTDAAEYITRNHPELGLPLFERWNIGRFTPSMRGVVKWAAEDPRHAAEFTMGIRSHYPATEAMKTIGEQWAQIDPAAAMAYADAQQSTLGRTLATSVLETWARRDLPGAAEWLANTDQATRNQFSAPIVEQWAKSDPAAALRWCEENLAGTSLADSAAGVLRGAAEKDPQAAARLVQAMEPSAARSAGAVEVAAKLLPGRVSYGAATDQPPTAETLAWLNSLDPDAKRRVLQKAVRSWPDADAKSMASFLLTTTPDKIPSSVYLLVGRALGRTDPPGALEWANQLPAEARLAGGSDAFANWCQSQPENAMQWLSNIPATDPRYSAYLKTALEYLAYEHNTTERVAALPHLDRTAALDLAKQLDLSPDRRARLLSALKSN